MENAGHKLHFTLIHRVVMQVFLPAVFCSALLIKDFVNPIPRMDFQQLVSSQFRLTHHVISKKLYTLVWTNLFDYISV